jgi:hypothetical protein
LARNPDAARSILVAQALQRACRFEANGGGMRRRVPQLGFYTRFVFRRIDRVAGEVNAFLIAMALGLGVLDLAYAIDRLLTALPAR